MITITLSGVILFDYKGDFQSIELVDPATNYKTDLINKFEEIATNYPDKEVQVSYYLSNLPISEIEMKERFIAQLSGGIFAEYEQEDYNYSSWTNGSYYYSYLQIGGHDLFTELRKEDGKYIILKINVQL